MKKPVIALSLGDPAGIGPEVALKAIADPKVRRSADFVLAGLPSSLPKGMKVPQVGWLRPSSGRPWPSARPSAASGRIAADSLRLAAGLVMTGSAGALVTAPLSKEALHRAGEDFAGHTEMLADMVGLKPDQVGMLLVGGGLRVFLATRHVGLAKAISLLELSALKKSIRLCANGLNGLFSIPKPRLALAALNPHAGEGGAFGDEEGRILRPVLRSFRAEKKFHLSGPIPADTVFVRAQQGRYDVVVCLYHDQGLIPLKLLAFDSGVNVTLGLPFIRTSPDHGTAYDIAGKNKADPGSMKAAIRLAIDLAKKKSAAI